MAFRFKIFVFEKKEAILGHETQYRYFVSPIPSKG